MAYSQARSVSPLNIYHDNDEESLQMTESSRHEGASWDYEESAKSSDDSGTPRTCDFVEFPEKQDLRQTAIVQGPNSFHDEEHSVDSTSSESSPRYIEMNTFQSKKSATLHDRHSHIGSMARSCQYNSIDMSQTRRANADLVIDMPSSDELSDSEIKRSACPKTSESCLPSYNTSANLGKPDDSSSLEAQRLTEKIKEPDTRRPIRGLEKANNKLEIKKRERERRLNAEQKGWTKSEKLAGYQSGISADIDKAIKYVLGSNETELLHNHKKTKLRKKKKNSGTVSCQGQIISDSTPGVVTVESSDDSVPRRESVDETTEGSLTSGDSNNSKGSDVVIENHESFSSLAEASNAFGPLDQDEPSMAQIYDKLDVCMSESSIQEDFKEVSNKKKKIKEKIYDQQGIVRTVKDNTAPLKTVKKANFTKTAHFSEQHKKSGCKVNSEVIVSGPTPVLINQTLTGDEPASLSSIVDLSFSAFPSLENSEGDKSLPQVDSKHVAESARSGTHSWAKVAAKKSVQQAEFVERTSVQHQDVLTIDTINLPKPLYYNTGKHLLTKVVDTSVASADGQVTVESPLNHVTAPLRSQSPCSSVSSVNDGTLNGHDSEHLHKSGQHTSLLAQKKPVLKLLNDSSHDANAKSTSTKGVEFLDVAEDQPQSIGAITFGFDDDESSTLFSETSALTHQPEHASLDSPSSDKTNLLCKLLNGHYSQTFEKPGRFNIADTVRMLKREWLSFDQYRKDGERILVYDSDC